MAAGITYLSTEIEIGGKKFRLETDHFPAVKDAEGLIDKLKCMELKTPKDTEIPVNLGALTDWIKEKFGDVGFGALNSVLGNSVFNDIDITLWNLRINVKEEFEFHIKISFNEDFYNKLKMPDIIKKIIKIDSAGIGFEYTKNEETVKVKSPKLEAPQPQLDRARTLEKQS